MSNANEILKAAEEFLKDIPDDVPTMGLTSLLYGNENMNSDIISCLLYENDYHKQGEKFLNLFIKQVFNKKFGKFVSTKREDHTKEGRRIDIVIEFEKSIIGIECKTNDYTVEQDKQLEDYYNELCTRKNKENVYLIYLTPFGKSSTTLKEDDKKELGERYKEISWSKDIIDWLNECIKCIDKCENCENCENLKAEIYLYIEYIKKITYQDTRGKIMIEEMFKKLETCSNEELQKLKEYQEILNRFHIKTFQVIKALKDKDIVYWKRVNHPTVEKIGNFEDNHSKIKEAIDEGALIVSIKSSDPKIYYGYICLQNSDEQILKICSDKNTFKCLRNNLDNTYSDIAKELINHSKKTL